MTDSTGQDGLLDLRDDLAVTKNLAAALVMACSTATLNQCAALGALANVVRERLEAALDVLDGLIEAAQP